MAQRNEQVNIEVVPSTPPVTLTPAHFQERARFRRPSVPAADEDIQAIAGQEHHHEAPSVVGESQRESAGSAAGKETPEDRFRNKVFPAHGLKVKHKQPTVKRRANQTWYTVNTPVSPLLLPDF